MDILSNRGAEADQSAIPHVRRDRWLYDLPQPLYPNKNLHHD
jgi:hypothetical protein